MDIENRRKRIYVRAEEAHEVKSCKTCDFCVKPDMYDTSRWQCKAPENILLTLFPGEDTPHQSIEPISGDLRYKYDCEDNRYDPLFNSFGDKCGPEGKWYQLDPYIPINGKRQVDIYREKRKLSTPSKRVSIKNLTLKDIL